MAGDNWTAFSYVIEEEAVAITGTETDDIAEGGIPSWAQGWWRYNQSWDDDTSFDAKVLLSQWTMVEDSVYTDSNGAKEYDSHKAAVVEVAGSGSNYDVIFGFPVYAHAGNKEEALDAAAAFANSKGIDAERLEETPVFLDTDALWYYFEITDQGEPGFYAGIFSTDNTENLQITGEILDAVYAIPRYSYLTPADVALELKRLMEEYRDTNEYWEEPPFGSWPSTLKWLKWDTNHRYCIDQRDVRVITQEEWETGSYDPSSSNTLMLLNEGSLQAVDEPWCYVESGENGYEDFTFYTGKFLFEKGGGYNQERSIFSSITYLLGNWIREQTTPSPLTVEVVDAIIQQILEAHGIADEVKKLNGNPWENLPEGTYYYYDETWNSISWSYGGGIDPEEAEMLYIALDEWYLSNYLENYLRENGAEAVTMYSKSKITFSNNNTSMKVQNYYEEDGHSLTYNWESFEDAKNADDYDNDPESIITVTR
ncbi:MAG TPA: hypothetical protein DEQ14_08830, partial [Treponema sp.]|nr:hypothetical protein [Treponema sp.]